MTSLSPAWESTLFGILLLAGALWIGGMITVILVARISSATLEPTARVAFFRTFGRVYGIIWTIVLLVGMIAGGILLGTAAWTGLSTAMAVLAALLVVSLAWGIVQAVHMSRLRRAATEDDALHPTVRRRAGAAAALRAVIAVVTVALFVLALVDWL